MLHMLLIHTLGKKMSYRFKHIPCVHTHTQLQNTNTHTHTHTHTHMLGTVHSGWHTLCRSHTQSHTHTPSHLKCVESVSWPGLSPSSSYPGQAAMLACPASVCEPPPAAWLLPSAHTHTHTHRHTHTYTPTLTPSPHYQPGLTRPK